MCRRRPSHDHRHGEPRPGVWTAVDRVDISAVAPRMQIDGVEQRRASSSSTNEFQGSAAAGQLGAAYRSEGDHPASLCSDILGGIQHLANPDAGVALSVERPDARECGRPRTGPRFGGARHRTEHVDPQQRPDPAPGRPRH